MNKFIFCGLSVQNLFDAPAAQEEVQTLLHGADESMRHVSSQEVLASAQAHGHVTQALPQRGGQALPQRGGHGLRQRTLGMHASVKRATHRDEEDGEQAERTT